MLNNLQELSDISKFLPMVHHYKADGHRFITMSAVDNGDTFDIYYHFDKDLELAQIKVSIAHSDSIPSISYIYSAAFLVENEVKELFGVNITDISIDFGGRLLLSEGMNTPMAVGGNLIIERLDEDKPKEKSQGEEVNNA